VGKDLAYGKIVSALQIESSQVEVWVIDGNIYVLLRKRSRTEAIE
jgi:hypothetical protein